MVAIVELIAISMAKVLLIVLVLLVQTQVVPLPCREPGWQGMAHTCP